MADEISVAEAINRVQSMVISRSAVEGMLPECHRKGCQGSHPSSDEVLALFAARAAYALLHPESSRLYRPLDAQASTEPA